MPLEITGLLLQTANTKTPSVSYHNLQLCTTLKTCYVVINIKKLTMLYKRLNMSFE